VPNHYVAIYDVIPKGAMNFVCQHKCNST